MSSASRAGLVVAGRRGSPQRLEVCNIPTDPSLELSQDVSLLLENIRLTIAWASKIADSLLEEKLASGELQAEDLDNIENYRREAVNAAFDRHATWLTPSVRTTISSPLDICNGVLTPNPRLTSIGIPPNSDAFDLLRNTIEDIKRASLGSEATVYHYNHIVSINFDPRTEGLDATLQTLRLSLKVTKSASKNHSNMWTPAWMSGIVLKVDRGHWACPARFLDWLASMIPGEAEEIHVDSEISRVQYQFSNNMFMDLKDTVIRTVQGVGMDGRACG